MSRWLLSRSSTRARNEGAESIVKGSCALVEVRVMDEARGRVIKRVTRSVTVKICPEAPGAEPR